MNQIDYNAESKDHYVYVWKYPENMNDGKMFYVGQGKHGNKSKYARAHAIHYQDKKRRKSYAQNVFDKIIRSGYEPIIEIISDNLTIEEAHLVERDLILQFGRRDIGTGILCNLTEGGDINPMNDPVVRVKQLNAVRSQEHRIKRSIGASEVNARPEVYERNKINGIKMWECPEFREKMLKMRNTLEARIKNRKTQSELNGVKVVFNGVEYPSKFELSRHLGISFQMLTYRLKNNIPLDAPKNYRRSTFPST